MSYIATFITSSPTAMNGVRPLYKGRKPKMPKAPIANPGVQQTASGIAQAEQDQLTQQSKKNGLSKTKYSFFRDFKKRREERTQAIKSLFGE